MTTLKITLILIFWTSATFAQTCVVPAEYATAVGTSTAQLGAVLTTTTCPYDPNYVGASHTCVQLSNGVSGWNPAILCSPPQQQQQQVVVQQQVIQTVAPTFCAVPLNLQASVRTTTAGVGARLTVTSCNFPSVGIPGTHFCTASGAWSPPIQCLPGQPQPIQPRPIVPVIAPRPVIPRRRQIDLPTLLLLQRWLAQRRDDDDDDNNNSTSGSGRKKRFVELEELNSDETKGENEGLAAIFGW